MLVSAETGGGTTPHPNHSPCFPGGILRDVQSECGNNLTDDEDGGIEFISGILVPPVAFREESVQMLGLWIV